MMTIGSMRKVLEFSTNAGQSCTYSDTLPAKDAFSRAGTHMASLRVHRSDDSLSPDRVDNYSAMVQAQHARPIVSEL
jgi:hypothetical protein